MTQTAETLTIQEAFNRTVELYQEGNYKQSLDLAAKILEQAPDDVNVKYYVGLSLTELGEYAKAEAFLADCYKAAPESDSLCFSIGRLYSLSGNTQKAIEFYRVSSSLNPKNIGALNNLANIYNEQGNSDVALQYFNKILEVSPDLHFAYNNIALIYKKAGLFNDALANILKSIEIKPDVIESQHNAALIYTSMGANQNALEHYAKCYEMEPDNLLRTIEYYDTLCKVCDWDLAETVGKKLKEFTDSDEILPVMTSLQKNQNSEKTLKTARAFTESSIKRVKETYPRFEIDKERRNKKGKIRIGYMSSDIKDHPVSHLMRGVFKNHNKDEFEIYLYSFSSEDNTGYKETIASYCDKFIDLRQYSNYDTAQIINKDEIDIIIDLNGHTGASRVESLYLKPAPIQVNYLGYIGTMGADFIDYIITDKIVTPPEHQQFYDEKFVYMPDCYQANDDDLIISNEEITKESQSLPEDKFIFCSFNQTYKIEPVMFDTWMNILKRVPDSVLWLYKGSIFKDDTLAIENLKKEAEKRGIDASRLIFAEGIPIDKHLKRIGMADLALDTRLYNGGTVTSQTLWAGTPVVTLQGWHFASRMASSILRAVGLSELVTTSAKDYEDLAVELANNTEKLANLKSRLKENIKKEPLFDTAKFTRNLEKAYKAMWRKYADGKDAEAFKVGDAQD